MGRRPCIVKIDSRHTCRHKRTGSLWVDILPLVSEGSGPRSCGVLLAALGHFIQMEVAQLKACLEWFLVLPSPLNQKETFLGESPQEMTHPFVDCVLLLLEYEKAVLGCLLLPYLFNFSWFNSENPFVGKKFKVQTSLGKMHRAVSFTVHPILRLQAASPRWPREPQRPPPPVSPPRVFCTDR